jgi:hypothetical protein
MKESILFRTGVLAGTIRVREILLPYSSSIALIVTAMLRDKSVFIDGGVQLYRKTGTTWLGFSKLLCSKGRDCLQTYRQANTSSRST